MSDESYLKTVFANVKTVQISMSDESYVKTVLAGVSKQFKFRCRMKVMLRQFSLLCQNSSNFDVG